LETALILLIWAATAQAQDGNVTFYRMNGWSMSARKVTIICDDKITFHLPNRSRATILLAPGEHRCWDKNDRKRQVEPLVVEVYRDEDRYVWVQWHETPTSLKVPIPWLELHERGWSPDKNHPGWRELRNVTVQ